VAAKRERDAAAEQLATLRKGEGLSLARLEERPQLIALCGSATAAEAEARLREALIAMSGSRYAAALKAALGIDRALRGDLSERRQAHADLVGRAPYTVREWEDRGIEEVRLYLLATDSRLLPELPRPSFLILDLEAEYRYKRRRFIESVQTRTVVALLEADSFRYGLRGEELQLLPSRGCTSRVETKTTAGAVYRLTFPRPLLPGERHTFSFTERRLPSVPTPAAELVSDFAGQSFEQPAQRFTVRVVFGEEVPRVVWAYERLTDIERPGQPSRGVNTLNVRCGAATHTFADAAGGLRYGAAWTW